MNIIIFTSSSNRSGGSRQALYMAQAFYERGHSVIFFHPPKSSLPGLAPNFPCFKSLGDKNEWKKNIEAAIPKDGSGCIIHAFHNAAVKKASWWGLLWKDRAVVVAHRGVIFRPNNPLPYWSPGIASFLVNSQKCLGVLKRIGVSLERLAVVPNAVPDTRVTPNQSLDTTLQELDLKTEHFIFGTIANDSPVKGVKGLLKSFAPVFKRHPEKARLVIIGVDKNKWEPLCFELGIETAVRLLGHKEDVANYLHAMKSFILPSLSESMPNTLLEALRCHLPSIGTHVGAVKEVIGTGGIVIPPGDETALTTAMEAFIADPARVAACKEATYALAKNYTPSVKLVHLQYIYRSLLAQRGFSTQ